MESVPSTGSGPHVKQNMSLLLEDYDNYSTNVEICEKKKQETI